MQKYEQRKMTLAKTDLLPDEALFYTNRQTDTIQITRRFVHQ